MGAGWQAIIQPERPEGLPEAFGTFSFRKDCNIVRSDVILRSAVTNLQVIRYRRCNPVACKPNKMKRHSSMRHLLTILLIGILFGVTACGASTPGGEAPGEPADSYACADSNPHPIGESIAATYEVSYQQVMTWFCGGYSFENILIALETSEAVDVPADTLLQMLLEKEWEEIWREVGFVE